MTTETHLVTDFGMLSLRARRPAVGGIWLATGDSKFPRAGWNDFVVVVLGWWAGAVLRLLTTGSERERVQFMDGPYAVEIFNEQSGKFRLRMFAGPSGGSEVAVGEADIKGFVSELAAQSRRLLDECRMHGWWSPEAEALASHLHGLDRRLADWQLK